MKFRYARFGDTRRPVIPIKVKWRSREVQYDVLVDSGADECLFSVGIAADLGIDLETGEMRKAQGVAGPAATYLVHPVDIEIGEKTYSIEAGFMHSDRLFGYGTAGQQGFFDLFRITFDLFREEIELQPRF